MIKIRDVIKKYGKQIALNKLNLEIKESEFFAILGPNGAGKTTISKLISTLILPNGGSINIDNEILTRDSVHIKKKISLMSQEYSLRNDMKVSQIMELQGRLYQIPKEKRLRKTNELLEFCDLINEKDKKVRNLSGGMKRKLMISRALLTEPKILLLDEPTVGLDPISRRHIWKLLRNLNENGLTIILTTHYIEEAQLLCDRVAMLNKGKLINCKVPKQFIDELGNIAVDVYENNEIKNYYFNKKDDAIRFVNILENRFEIRSTTLEDVFIEVVGERIDA